MITVDRGAEFLDQHYPGWFDLIDTDTLQIDDSCQCVLGQIYLREHPRIRAESSRIDAFYRKARELGFSEDSHHLRIDWPLARSYGFAVGNGRITNLTAAWRRAIEKRRAATT
jgi:hypothetical protein